MSPVEKSTLSKIQEGSIGKAFLGLYGRRTKNKIKYRRMGRYFVKLHLYRKDHKSNSTWIKSSSSILSENRKCISIREHSISIDYILRHLLDLFRYDDQ